MKLCLNCGKNPARIEDFMGVKDCVLPCKDCQERLNKISKEDKLGSVYEFTTDEIREGRKQYAKQLLQPWRQGQISKEYLEAYPKQAQGMIKEGILTREQVRKAKNVWQDIPGVRNL
jgi:hypothetical protein